MATGIVQGRFQFQDGSKEELEASDLILLKGEIALETDEEGTTRIKRGDGRSKYGDLPYISAANVKISDFTDDDLTMLKKDIANAIDLGDGLKKTDDTIAIDKDKVATKDDLKGYAKSIDVPKIVTLTQAQYDALSTKDSNTYYFIKE